MSERDRLHWLLSSWCHIPVRLLDYIEENTEPESLAQIDNTRTDLFLFTTTTRSPKKTTDADAVTCALLLSIPGVCRVNLQCGRAVSACIRAYTPVCSASRHPSHWQTPHTLLQFTRSSSHRPSINMGIACSALHKPIGYECVETHTIK